MKPKSTTASKSRSSSVWQWLAVVLLMILVPWAGYITYHPSFSSLITPLTQSKEIDIITKGIESGSSLEMSNKASMGSAKESEFEETESVVARKEIAAELEPDDEKPTKTKKNAKKKKKMVEVEETDEEADPDEEIELQVKKPKKKSTKKNIVEDVSEEELEDEVGKKGKMQDVTDPDEDGEIIEVVEERPPKTDKKTKKRDEKKPARENKKEEKKQKKTAKKSKQTVTDKTSWMPVLGEIPTAGTEPLYGIQHQGGDAIFALACNYPKNFYQRFVGSLRKAEYEGDIVLAVSPPEKMKPGVEQYIKKMKVVGYAFDVDCIGKDNCKLKDDFLGYPDPRPHRTFANIRYALYEYWLRHYSDTSYVLILDFRDTFFQLDPFAQFGPVETRSPKYDLRLYAENFKVKSIGKCVYNSLWVGRCFGKPALAELREKAVICSGSTLGSYQAIHHYIQTMLKSMDSVKCWLKGIESDQGYQNYLFYNGYFNTDSGNATLFQQGEDVVNTIGAMNGFRVPKELKGPLDTHWKIRDKDGYILNNDGTRSACVHQWDRWYSEVVKFLDTKLY